MNTPRSVSAEGNIPQRLASESEDIQLWFVQLGVEGRYKAIIGDSKNCVGERDIIG